MWRWSTSRSTSTGARGVSPAAPARSRMPAVPSGFRWRTGTSVLRAAFRTDRGVPPREVIMKVNEVMTLNVQIANPDQTIRDAARLMADIDAGVLPVGEN